MRSIFKFTVPTGDHRTFVSAVPMHSGAKVLSAGCQGSDLVIWAEVLSDSPIVTRKIRVIGTGWNLDTIDGDCNHPFLGNFIGTVQFRDGTGLVFHLFDLGEEN